MADTEKIIRKKYDVPIWHKSNLTIDEAVEYSGIGRERPYQEKLISNAEEPIWERKWLTIEEAAAYSGIGRTKLRELSNQAGCPFAIWIGNKIHIVRERLDKYIDKQFRI